MARPGLSYEPPLWAWNVGSIVAELCERAGVPYYAYETDLLEGHVEGYSTSAKDSASSAIDALASIFLFDISNYDGMLHGIPRGLPHVAEISPDDCLDDGDTLVEISRGDAISIPRVVNLKYFDSEGGLTADKQTSDRTLDDRATNEATTETAVIMRADDAARAAVISHKITIEEQRGDITFRLPDSWIWLTTGDCVLYDGNRVRIRQIDVDEGFQKYTCVYDRISAYESSIAGLPIVQPSTPPALTASDSVIEFIDSHILSSQDDTLGYYAAVSSKTMDWTGAFIEISKDGGQSWIDSDFFTSNSIMGETTTTLAAHSAYYPDPVNKVTVKLLRNDMMLDDATLREMMNRSNLAIIGDELINFGSAEQVSDDEWELSYFLRGRKGSGAVSHAVGERFVLLNGAEAFIPAELFELGRTLTFRATSIGADAPSATITVTLIGRSQKERQPAYLQARRDGANTLLSWQGVGRLGGGSSVGMGRYFVEYLVKQGANEWRTTARTLSIPYAAGTISVQQINQITGAGPALSVSV